MDRNPPSEARLTDRMPKAADDVVDLCRSLAELQRRCCQRYEQEASFIDANRSVCEQSAAFIEYLWERVVDSKGERIRIPLRETYTRDEAARILGYLGRNKLQDAARAGAFGDGSNPKSEARFEDLAKAFLKVNKRVPRPVGPVPPPDPVVAPMDGARETEDPMDTGSTNEGSIPGTSGQSIGSSTKDAIEAHYSVTEGLPGPRLPEERGTLGDRSLFSFSDAARYVNCEETRFAELVSDGEISPAAIDPNRFTYAELDSFVERSGGRRLTLLIHVYDGGEEPMALLLEGRFYRFVGAYGGCADGEVDVFEMLRLGCAYAEAIVLYPGDPNYPR